MIADAGYDDKKLYEYSRKILGIDLVCPIERYKSSSKKRIELVCFYESALGQVIYKIREKYIYIVVDREHIKSVFRIETLITITWISYGICDCTFVCFALSDNVVYYNCKTHTINPKSIKYMLGTLM